MVPADKTTNYYRMDAPAYNDLLQKNITKTYKKVAPDVTNPIDLEAKCIAKKLQLDDRVNATAKREAFITLKDHNQTSQTTLRVALSIQPSPRSAKSANKS